MTTAIATVEQHIIDTVKGFFGSRLREVNSLPADWDADTFRRIWLGCPGVFVAFGGGPIADTGRGPEILARWVLVAATTHAGSEAKRRLGDAREIGAYEIVELLAGLLHDHVVPGVGTMALADMENLFQPQVEKQGGTLYGVAFNLPMLLAPGGADAATLDDFLTFDDTIDLAPQDGAPEAADHVVLPQ